MILQFLGLLFHLLPHLLPQLVPQLVPHLLLAIWVVFIVIQKDFRIVLGLYSSFVAIVWHKKRISNDYQIVARVFFDFLLYFFSFLPSDSSYRLYVLPPVVASSLKLLSPVRIFLMLLNSFVCFSVVISNYLVN